MSVFLLEKKSKKSIIDRVKTFEDACEILNLDPVEELPYNQYGLTSRRKSINAHTKLVIITEALNEGWKPNWVDSNERKWYPYFTFAPVFGLCGTHYSYYPSNTNLGFRLYLKSQELAEYMSRQFIELYKKYMIILD